MITYATRLIFESEQDKQRIISMLESQRSTFNECSRIRFEQCTTNSIVELHGLFYREFRNKNPHIPSQIVIRSEQECLSCYRSIKSNKHKISSPCIKKNLSIRLDERIYSYKSGIFRLTTLEKRISAKPYLYPKLEELLKKYQFADPELFVRNGDIWINITFELPQLNTEEGLVCGVDVGIRMSAVTSEGEFYRDKKFNCDKRKLRYLRRCLFSKGSKTAKKHLRKLRGKERNKNRSQTHLLSNAILSCKATAVAIENLKGIKKKSHKYQNKNKISQVPIYLLERYLKYKAPLRGKRLITVNPHYTSQIDHRTHKRQGERRGRRFYGSDGVVLDADHNAACNIAHRSKLPISYVRVLDGQVDAKPPYAKS